jgi:hypothetical protein
MASVAHVASHTNNASSFLISRTSHMSAALECFRAAAVVTHVAAAILGFVLRLAVARIRQSWQIGS